MQRIRTIKPELFKHEALFDAEQETGLPLRFIFSGLWTSADREGRFKWRPRSLKAEVFPFDSWDMVQALDALASRGWIVKYESNGESYGYIPSWKEHQNINNRESESSLPRPPQQPPRDANATRDVTAQDASFACTRGIELNRTEQNRTESASTTGEAESQEPRDEPKVSPEMISRAVLVELRLSGDRLQYTLTDQARLELARGQPPDAVRDAMIASWRKYDGSAAKLSYHCKPTTFFGDGRWRNEAAWGWKQGEEQAPKRKIYANAKPA